MCRVSQRGIRDLGSVGLGFSGVCCQAQGCLFGGTYKRTRYCGAHVEGNYRLGSGSLSMPMPQASSNPDTLNPILPLTLKTVNL